MIGVGRLLVLALVFPTPTLVGVVLAVVVEALVSRSSSPGGAVLGRVILHLYEINFIICGILFIF